MTPKTWQSTVVSRLVWREVFFVQRVPQLSVSQRRHLCPAGRRQRRRGIGIPVSVRGRVLGRGLPAARPVLQRTVLERRHLRQHYVIVVSILTVVQVVTDDIQHQYVSVKVNSRFIWRIISNAPCTLVKRE